MPYHQYLFRELSQDLANDYVDNWDTSRFGAEPKQTKSIKQRVVQFLNKKNYYNLNTLTSAINSLEAEKFEYLYNQLTLEEDKELLLKVLAYRLMGYRKVKLPLNNEKYWTTLDQLKELRDTTDYIKPGFLNATLSRMKLDKIGFPIELYFVEQGVMIDYIIKQYEYNKSGKVIKAETDDVVIDAGGCWGDTALFFANEVGAKGKVYVFEFIPNNIGIMQKNLSLNIDLEKRIEIIPQPLWNEPDTKIYFKDFGPASEVRSEPFEGMDGESVTTTIDDLVKDKQLEKVDFIKMDIEGAETNAIKGAAETIKKFKPKLAITLYHSVEDFERIPKLVKELVPAYKFYFSHCTIHSEESLLFAEIEK